MKSSLDSLAPDLIITQELCEVCATPLREVSKTIANLNPKPGILSLTPHNLEEVLQDVVKVGRATGSLERAKEILSKLESRVDKVKEKCMDSSVQRPSVFCLEWLDPVYCSGHWMPELVDYSGGREGLGKFGEPSTVVEWEKVLKIDPEVIFVTVCGYDVQRTLSEISTLTGKEGWGSLRQLCEIPKFSSWTVRRTTADQVRVSLTALRLWHLFSIRNFSLITKLRSLLLILWPKEDLSEVREIL